MKSTILAFLLSLALAGTAHGQATAHDHAVNLLLDQLLELEAQMKAAKNWNKPSVGVNRVRGDSGCIDNPCAKQDSGKSTRCRGCRQTLKSEFADRLGEIKQKLRALHELEP